MGNRFQGIVASALAATGLVVLAGCTGDPGEIADCEDLLERVSLSVEGVDSAEFTCERDFGNPGQGGTVTLAADAQKEATTVIEDVFRAFANEPEIDDAWIVYLDFISPTGKSFSIEELDFNGTPPMGEVRDRYDIHPPGTD